MFVTGQAPVTTPHLPPLPHHLHTQNDIAMAPASRASVVRLLSLTANGGCRGCGRTHGVAHHHPPSPALPSHIHGMGMGMRGLATPIDIGGYNPPPGNTDYAFEVGPMNDIWFGRD